MQSRFEDLTKEQLIAELKDRKQELVLAYEKNQYLLDQVDHFEQQEKKREFERRLAEATDFLKANGYKVEIMTSAERFPVDEGKQELPGGVQVRPPERVWTDNDMISFAVNFKGGSFGETAKNCLDKFEQICKS